MFSPAMIGMFTLLVAFVGAAASVILLVIGQVLSRKSAAPAGVPASGGTPASASIAGGASAAGSASSAGEGTLSETLSWSGRVAALVSTVALTVCMVVLGYCFLTDNYSIQYVLSSHSNNAGSLAWLYKLSGVWAGREGSLLFWAWLIAIFGAIVAVRDMGQVRKLDNVACLVMQAVLAAFVGVLLFSEANMPFEPTDAKYFTEAGTLTKAAQMLGMNTLLEHWAMAIHPPTLFVGYAGLTVPFAYAISALIVNDASPAWVQRSTRYALVNWLFLTAGIGLGALWAYVVLGWGGYWGWDAVENASLLSWLMAVALIHSFTVYRQRGAFKGWSILCACLTFAFVIVGTFISRSGLVQSVHAFEGDPVSLVLFGALIVISIVLGIVLLVVRRSTFGTTERDDFESMASKGAMYYLSDVILLVMTLLITYMTISSALPSWLPFGGESLSTDSYNVIARPVGVIFLGMMAVCPLLGWQKANKAAFAKQARIPALCALVLFIVLVVYFVLRLSPAYDATISAGGSDAMELAMQGPAWYYKGLSVVGFAVAALLFFNALFMAIRQRRSASALSGAISHAGMAIILVGLIGSSMYVTENAGYLAWNEETDTCEQDYVAGDYLLRYQGNQIFQAENGNYIYQVDFDAYAVDAAEDGTVLQETYVGHASPQVEMVAPTQQQKLNASVISFPTEDLFVVYRGVSSGDDALSLDVRVNPLVNCVWVGFYVLMAGMLVGVFGKRATRKEQEAEGAQEDAGEGVTAAAEADAMPAVEESATPLPAMSSEEAGGRS